MPTHSRRAPPCVPTVTRAVCDRSAVAFAQGFRDWRAQLVQAQHEGARRPNHIANVRSRRKPSSQRVRHSSHYSRLNGREEQVCMPKLSKLVVSSNHFAPVTFMQECGTPTRSPNRSAQHHAGSGSRLLPAAGGSMRKHVSGLGCRCWWCQRVAEGRLRPLTEVIPAIQLPQLSPAPGGLDVVGKIGAIGARRAQLVGIAQLCCDRVARTLGGSQQRGRGRGPCASHGMMWPHDPAGDQRPRPHAAAGVTGSAGEPALCNCNYQAHQAQAKGQIQLWRRQPFHTRGCTEA